MTKLSIEAKVGFFVVISVLMLAYMSMRVGVFKYGVDRGYEVYGHFDSAEGLVVGVPVEIAGVEVGQVKGIALEAGKAKVTLLLRHDVQVSEDVQAALRTKGVLGDRYVEIMPGPPGSPPLKPGGRIQRTLSPANLDSLLGQLSTIAEDLGEITGPVSDVLRGTEGEEAPLQAMVRNFVALAQALNETVQRNQQNINLTLDNFTAFSATSER